MRFALVSLVIALFAAVAMAVPPTLLPVIISYPKDTPWDVVDSAKQAIKDAGGAITHEYSIIKGFAAQMPEGIMDAVSTMNEQYTATIEGDGIMHTMDKDTKVQVNKD